MSENLQESAGVRPYGPLGLALSIVVAAILTALILAAMVLLYVLADVVLFGRAHFSASLSSLMEAAGEGELTQFKLPLFLVGSLIYLSAIAAILTLARFRGRANWRSLLALRGFERDALYWALVAGAVAYGLCAGWAIVKIYPDAKNWFQLPSGGLALSVAFLLVVGLAPLAEELLFRGWLYTGLRAHMGVGATIALTSVLFAFAHWEKTGLYALAVLPMGVLMGYLRERTGSVRSTIVLHGIYNCSGFLAKLLLPD